MAPGARAQSPSQAYLFNQYTLPYQTTFQYGLAITSGDFNHDGKTDFALTSTYPYGAQIILGNTNGGLSVGNLYSVVSVNGNDLLENIVSADFNNDGKLDLVAFDATASDYVLFLGNNDGTFMPASVIATGYYESGLAAIDLNHDGKLDLVTGQLYGGVIQIILGNGNGTFQTPVQYFAGFGAINSLAVADINKDGNIDVIAMGSSVEILLGNGDGALQPATELVPTAPYAYSIAVGDINGDGKQDIVVGGAGAIDVFIGTGNGGFGAPVESFGGTPGYYMTNIALADLNGDRKLDVLGGSGYSVTAWVGNGDGTFRTPVRTFANGYFPGSGLNALLTGDFNADGKVDVATLAESGTLVSLFSGNGDGTLDVGADITGAAGSVYAGATSTDFNGDGKADFAAVNTGTGRIEVYLGKGTGTFQLAKRFVVGTSPQQVIVGDFNNDGKMDLATTNQGENTVSVLLGNGNGTFQTQKKFSTGSFPYGLATADLNGDGKFDLVIGTEDTPNVQVFLGNGDGTFGSATTWGAYGGIHTTVAIADVNGDGKLDIAATESDPYGAFSVLYGNGDGTFPTMIQTTTYANGEYSIAAVALQPGGLTDIVLGTSGGVYVIPSSSLGITGVPSYYFANPCGAQALIVGDFNGDGFPDVAGSCETGAPLWTGKGDGTFSSVSNFATAYFLNYSYGDAAADFNSDGMLDLVVTHQGGTISTILSNPVVVFSTTRVNFGKVTVGSTSTKMFSLTNQSNTKLTVTSITVTGVAAADYTQTNTCGSTLLAGANCKVTVTFKPTVTGSRNASVTFKDSEAGPSRVVSLTGIGQ